MIQKHQIYTLPSGTIVKINSSVDGTSDWNCSYQNKTHWGLQVALSGAFLRKFGEVWK